MSDIPPVSDIPAASAIARLHARYDGVIPRRLRAAALAGGEAGRARLAAEARRRMFDALARDSLAALAARRGRIRRGDLASDRALRTLARDLRFYRDRGAERRADLTVGG
ncbi:MAG: hypothetical protein FJ311_11325 [Rhodospirillales bacterium]|nr:hypothetical protein [Rhodospirillales bacterium]